MESGVLMAVTKHKSANVSQRRAVDRKDERVRRTRTRIDAAFVELLYRRAYGDIRVATRSLLGMEGISVVLIVILMVVIVVKLIAGSAPHGQSVTLDAFKIPGGTSFSAVPVPRGRVQGGTLPATLVPPDRRDGSCRRRWGRPRASEPAGRGYCPNPGRSIPP